jgi:hypothetical protein
MNRIVLLPLLLCVLALSACGGDDGGGGTGTASSTGGGGGATGTSGTSSSALSKDEYQDKLNDIMSKVQDQAGELGSIDPNDTDALAKSVEKAEGFLSGAVDSLKELDPPADVKQAHDDLIAGIQANVDADKEAADKLNDGDRTGAMKSLSDFATKGADQILTAMKAILAKGYDIAVFKDATKPATANSATATAQTVTAPSG